MSLLSTPVQYENDVHLEETGELIKRYGSSALVLAGKRAWAAAGEKLISALEDAGIKYRYQIIEGYPTREKFENISADIEKREDTDLIIAAGGGRIMDLAKAVAGQTSLPIVTVPTIAATCAAWSALSVIYTDEGAEDEYIYRDHFPELILVDRSIIKAAPRRYLISGVVDSIVKWYEITSNYNGNEDNFPLRLQIKVSELILDFLEKDFLEAADRDIDHIPEQVIDNAIDSVFMLAGLCGSIEGNVPYGGLCHHFYNEATHVPDTHVRLHGEIVIYGLFVQRYIEGHDRTEIEDRIRKAIPLGVPVTLAELGITENVEEKVRYIAGRMEKKVPEYAPVGSRLSAETIADAILEVSLIGKTVEKKEAA